MAFALSAAVFAEMPDAFLDWVENANGGSSNGAYLNTGIPCTDVAKMEADIAHQGDTNDRLFCGAYPSTRYYLLGFNNKVPYVGYRDKATPSNPQAVVVGERHTYVSVVTPTLRSLTIDGVETVHDETVKSVISPSSLPLYVFCYNNNGSRGAIQKNRVYSLKLYDGSDRLVADYRPCTKNGRVGFWDAVTETIKYSATADYEFNGGVDTVSTWTGLAGDGKFSSAGNWDNPLSAEKTANIVFPMTSSLTLNNDIEGLLIQKMTALSDAERAITINGNGYTLLPDVCTVTNVNVVITNNVPVNVPASTYLRYEDGGIVFNGKVTLGDNIRWNISGKTSSGKTMIGFVFNGTVDGPNAEIYSGSNTKAVFNSFVDLDKVTAGDWGGFAFEFNKGSAGSLVNKLTVSGYTSSQVFSTDNAVTENTVLSWVQAATADNNSRYALSCKSLTVDRLECPKPKMKDGSIGNKGSVYGADGTMTTLTLRMSQDSTANYSRLYGRLSLVVDAKGDFTQSVYDRVNEMSGTITIKRGTLYSAGTNSFPNLAKLVVGDHGVFKTDACNPFDRTVTDVEIAPGGMLDIPAGTKLTVRTLFYDGVPYGASSSDGITSAPFLTGGGAVEIANGVNDGVSYWKAAVDGTWATAENWGGAGLPDNALSRAAILSGSADYKVTVGADVGTISNLTVRSDTDHVAEVEVKAKLRLAETIKGSSTKQTLTIGRGGRVTVAEGGELEIVREGSTEYSADKSGVLLDGGELVVDGGRLCVTNYGQVVLGDATGSGPTNRISVRHGTFANYCTSWGSGINIYPNGEIDVSGDGVLDNISRNDVGYWRMRGGSIRVREHGTMVNDLYYSNAGDTAQGRIGFHEGLVTFSDYARFENRHDNGQFRMTSLASDKTCRVVFEGNSCFTNLWGVMYVGCGEVGRALAAYGPSELVLDSDVVHGQGNKAGNAYSRDTVATRMDIGGSRSSGTVIMKRGQFKVGGYALAIGSTTSSANTEKYERGEGTLRVEGGNFSVDGSYGTTTGWGYHYGYGVMIGDGRTSQLSSDYGHRGLLEIVGGTFTNHNGAVLCGAVCGEGTIRQSAGEFISDYGTFSSYVTPNLTGNFEHDKAFRYQRRGTNETMVVGMAGGRGRVELSGGKFDLASRMCIGGASTNEYIGACWNYDKGTTTTAWWWEGWDATRHFAKGELEISGTSDCKVQHVVCVGLDGTGTVSVVGSTCSVKFGGLVLTNGMEEASRASSASYLKYTTDASGRVSPIEITKNDVEICADAKLVLDVSAAAEPPKRKVSLVTFADGNDSGRIRGAFGRANVSIMGAAWCDRACLLQNERGIGYVVPSGTMLIFR